MPMGDSTLRPSHRQKGKGGKEGNSANTPTTTHPAVTFNKRLTL